MSQRRGLGRGLGALIPSGSVPGRGDSSVIDLRDSQVEVVPALPTATPDAATERVATDAPGLADAPQMVYAELPVGDVHPNPAQPRQAFDEDELAELAHSIAEIGLLQPIVVRPTTRGHELVAGERRLRAAQMAGLDRIPAIIRKTADDAMLRDALLENLHRAQLNPLEEAAAYSQLLKDFACTQEELALRIGRSRPQIANTLRLLKLPTSVQRRVAAGVLSAGHARALLGVRDPHRLEELAGRVVAEGLSVRAVEELVIVGEKESKAPRKPRSPAQVPVEYREAAARLSDHLETRVRIEVGRRRGRLIVEFAAVEDLVRIVEIIQSGREGG
ncbi:MAG: ParB/RepB/Spo0J family partition protein [Candidatus Nanopelagicales bacterium]|nr:ParB/RepB/Spo0J family partition protein [Candidatus Nanopelagicales bacterium]MDZ4248794.1 ParB/RepB/Spo0J family partition protein [Candidatus Nanopelagicales bacterium]